MASVMAGDKYRVYLEDNQGRLLEIDALSASVTSTVDVIDATSWSERERHFLPGIPETKIELVGLGPIVWADGKDFLNKKQNAKEWICEYCGNVNPREAQHCGEKGKHAKGCGASRSFIYDVL